MIFLVLILALIGHSAPTAQGGILDLQDWNWRVQGNIDLNGEWEFYWNTLQTEFVNTTASSMISLPAAWNRVQQSPGQNYPLFGCATYRLKIILPPERPHLGLIIPSIANASAVFADRWDLGQVGIPACESSHMISHWRDIYHPLPLSKSDTLELIVHASNFQTGVGGAWKPLTLGSFQEIENSFLLMRALRIFIAGVLFLMALYHVVLYSYRTSEKANIFFSAISLVGAYRLLSPGDHLISEVIPWIPWEFLIRVDFAIVGLGLILIYKFTDVLYEKFTKNPISHWVLGAALLHSFACLWMPLHWLIPSLVPMQWIFLLGYALLLRGLIKAIRAKCGWPCAIHLIAMLIFLATIINDFLYAKQWINTGYLASYGLIPVIIFQWFLMARSYSLTYNHAERRLHKFLRMMAQAIESKNRYTGDHVTRVAAISKLIAQRMMLTSDQLQQIELGAIVHDLGKIHLSDDILNKPSALNPEETALVQQHPRKGHHILSKIEGLDIPRNVILYHHENWDGSGYPSGLKKHEIPLEARIVAVADFWDAITSDRSYRRALDMKSALLTIKQEAGRRLDPRIVEVFISGGIADKA